MRPNKRFSNSAKWHIRIGVGMLLFVFAGISALGILVIKTKEIAFEETLSFYFKDPDEPVVENGPIPFPVSVDPQRKIIVENPDVEPFVSEHISIQTRDNREDTWLSYLTAKLAIFEWYQNLASPSSRILVILPGERKEEVVKNFGDILRWNKAEREEFLTTVIESSPSLDEGKFFPGKYVVSKDITPTGLAVVVINRFTKNITDRYDQSVAALVPFESTMIIASLLEREAYDFEDMRHISGVIWNRLFIEMNLQIDATLQYAKGTKPSTPVWWPQVHPRDKYIKSPYNTYQNEGLPPAPISNPSPAAIIAALNPYVTTCMFYFHDRNGGFHCGETYEEHVRLLRQQYGRGR